MNVGVLDFLIQLIQERAMYDQQKNIFIIRFVGTYIWDSYRAHQPHGDYSRSPELQNKNSAFEKP